MGRPWWPADGFAARAGCKLSHSPSLQAADLSDDLLKSEPIQRLGAAAQTGFASSGCKPFQCFDASTGSALSGRSV